MEIILWLVYGVLIGWVSYTLRFSSAKDKLYTDIILGVIGAFFGGLLMNYWLKSGVSTFHFESFLVSLVTASVVIGLGYIWTNT